MKKIKKILKLILRIAVNLVLIFWDWVKEKTGKNKKRTVIIGSVLLLAILTGGGILAWKKYKSGNDRENQPQVYEALVNVVDQKTSDPVEDARSSLKKGDVIVYFPEGHPWSETEKISYLIVKIKLRTDEVKKLTEAETKEIKREEGDEKGENSTGQDSSSSVGKFGQKDKNNPAIRDRGPQMETIRARKYFLDLPGYDVQKFWSDHSQPFEGRIFSDSIIDKK